MQRLPDDIIELEMEIERLRWDIAHDRAKELVLARGWTENDEDFLMQVEEEAKRQWEEDAEREIEKHWNEPDLL